MGGRSRPCCKCLCDKGLRDMVRVNRGRRGGILFPPRWVVSHPPKAGGGADETSFFKIKCLTQTSLLSGPRFFCRLNFPNYPLPFQFFIEPLRGLGGNLLISFPKFPP